MNKKRFVIVSLSTIMGITALIGMVVALEFTMENISYNKGVKLMEGKKYSEAIAEFKLCGVENTLSINNKLNVINQERNIVKKDISNLINAIIAQ